MTERKSFLLRLPKDLHADLERWSKDELRSLNAQIEFLLRDAVRRRQKGLPPDAQSSSPKEKPKD